MGDSRSHNRSSSAAVSQAAPVGRGGRLSLVPGLAASHGQARVAPALTVPAALLLGLALAGVAKAADPIVLSDSTSAAYRPSFSSDGKRLAMYYNREGIVRVWDVPAQKPLMELRASWPALSPDGKRLASQADKEAVAVWHVKTGGKLMTLPIESSIYSIVFSPDSKVLATGDREGRVRLWDVAKGEVIDKPGPNPAEPVVALLFSADGKVLVYATRDGTIKLHDVKERKTLATLKGYKTADQALAFSKDGKVLAYADRRGNGEDRPRVKFWDVAASKEAGEMLLLNGGISYLHQLDDGKNWLVWLDRRIDLQVVNPEMTMLDLLRAPRLFRAAEDQGSLWCVAVSPDRKKLLLSVGSDVRIIDMPEFPPKDVKEKSKKADK